MQTPSYYYQFENFINYNTTIGIKHEIGAMAGMSYEMHHSDNVGVVSEGADILQGYQPNYRYIDYLKPDAKVTANNAPNDSKNISYFGRLTYSYDNRYSIQANFRADAFDASKLPKDSRWGYFPSLSAGWTLSNESFIRDNISEYVLTFLKLRGSWGVMVTLAFLTIIHTPVLLWLTATGISTFHTSLHFLRFGTRQ